MYFGDDDGPGELPHTPPPEGSGPLPDTPPPEEPGPGELPNTSAPEPNLYDDWDPRDETKSTDTSR